MQTKWIDTGYSALKVGHTIRVDNQDWKILAVRDLTDPARGQVAHGRRLNSGEDQEFIRVEPGLPASELVGVAAWVSQINFQMSASFARQAEILEA